MAQLAKSLLLILAASWSLLAQAALPESFKNEYRTRIMGIAITVTHELSRQSDGTYLLSFQARSWVGSIEESTRFMRDGDGQVRPLEYQYRRRGLGRNRDGALRFDWQNAKITNLKGETWAFDPSLAVHDRLSYQVQLQGDVMAGGNGLTYHIAENDSLRTYEFEQVGRETLDTPLGKVATVKIKRSRAGSERVTYAWLATDWHYLLVRMQQYEDGESQTISINKAQVNGKNIARF